jgi:KUP system potassium uptake protein
MANVSGSMSSPALPKASAHGDARKGAAGLMLGALGVVFGDIGTSPLYALKETFAGHHPIAIDRIHILGVLSLVFWTITLIVSIKYVAILMRIDNRGEGGSLALRAVLERTVGDRPIARTIGMLGLFAAALFYGDCMITPAISVLSAVEGLNVAAPQLHVFIIPITVAILIGLFMLQRHGTAAIGSLFGPIMLLWFITLGAAGIGGIVRHPGVLAALSPHYAIAFIMHDGLTAFLAFGSVFLAVTGAEALYTDMGHFGRLPIRLGWYLIVLPGLVLNYFGQGALLLSDPAYIDNPFFRLVPDWLAGAMVGFAAVATIIASQAVISGAFSVTQQAVHLGYLPRLRTVYTSDEERGQIYLPAVNWMLLVFVVALVIGFGSSSDLAAAYGIAVTGSMMLDGILITMVAVLVWKWSVRKALLIFGLFLIIDVMFLAANATKIPYGGWFPLLVAFSIIVLLTTWKAGRALLIRIEMANEVTLNELRPTLSGITRVPGTAIFLTSKSDGLPAALLHNLKHNKVLHERNILLTVEIDDGPVVNENERIEAQDLGDGFRRLVLCFGYRDVMDIPRALAHATEAELGFFYLPMEVSYYISRETLIAAPGPDMSLWRKRLFLWMWRTAVSAMEFFRLPTNRVVELGSQSKI